MKIVLPPKRNLQFWNRLVVFVWFIIHLFTRLKISFGTIIHHLHASLNIIYYFLQKDAIISFYSKSTWGTFTKIFDAVVVIMRTIWLHSLESNITYMFTSCHMTSFTIPVTLTRSVFSKRITFKILLKNRNIYI